MSYRKVGGLHFVKVGRFGCSFYVSKATPKIPRDREGDLGSSLLLVVLACGAFFGL